MLCKRRRNLRGKTLSAGYPKWRLLICFRTFRIQNLFFEVISYSFGTGVPFFGQKTQEHVKTIKKCVCFFGFRQTLRLFGLKAVFLFSFSMQNHAESFRNFVNNSVLDLKRAKLDQKSPFGVSGGQGFPPKIPPLFYRASKIFSEC